VYFGNAEFTRSSRGFGNHPLFRPILRDILVTSRQIPCNSSDHAATDSVETGWSAAFEFYTSTTLSGSDPESPALKDLPESSRSDAAIPLELHGYDLIFWLAYLSNGLTTLANGMLVRYADFVSVLGGDEQQLGLIVGCGMIGSIAIRLIQGEAVDRYGASRVWRWSVSLYAVSLLLHLTLSTAYGPAIFLVRALMQASLAGVFGSSITFVSLRVRPQRMPEIIGALGTSGFLGLMVGAIISDWIGQGKLADRQIVELMLHIAAVLATTSVIATWFATGTSVVPLPQERPSLLRVVRQYHPWMISLTAAAMGAGFSIPAIFLRPFALEQEIPGVALFFTVYALTGFTARLASRSLFERYGNRPWILTGLMLLTISYLCYIPVTQTWHLIIPASVAGCAHALLFPSIMAAGTAVFPRRYLGVATSLILAMFDLGTFISAPVAGIFLRTARHYTTNSYPWMFAGAASIFAAVTAIFWFSRAARTSD
jgi:MFS family permease